MTGQLLDQKGKGLGRREYVIKVQSVLLLRWQANVQFRVLRMVTYTEVLLRGFSLRLNSS